MATEPVMQIGADDDRYPDQLRELADPPRALYVAGDLTRLREVTAGGSVAIVGTRKPTDYGRQMARSLARDLAATGVCVISGLAFGIDSAAHAGALEGDGLTVAVLAGGPERPSPAGVGPLYRRIVRAGIVISERPPGSTARRWAFPHRNRIIAALAGATIVVEARDGSGSLHTAEAARELGLPVGAVPGRVDTPAAEGPNALLAGGAAVIRDAQDALDLLYGVGVRSAAQRVRPALDPLLERLLAEIQAGHDSTAALARAGIGPGEGLVALAALELGGHIRRETGGRFVVQR